MPIYWGINLGWGESKVSCYLVDSQISRQLAGESGETGWFLLWICSWKFELTGEEGVIFAEGL